MDEKPFETMNVIPFVDIMLVLLTIVLTTSSFIASGKIPVNLPQASEEHKDNEQSQFVELALDGGLYFNGQRTTLDSLKGQVSAFDKQTTSFTIRADRDIVLQRFIDVADLLKQSGFPKVAVQIEGKQ